VDPSDATVMQLAIKKSLLGNAASFMWNGWADDGVTDPERFDYNDSFTLAEAGSPLSGTSDYPLKALFLVDNTCRLAFGFEATGNEPGVCFVVQPTPEPTPRPTSRPTNTVEQPPCDCSDFPNYTFMDTEACCTYCGYNWTGNVEFPCDLPSAPPPCNCSDFPNYTFMDTEACCTYCGYNWTGNTDFPCDLP